MTLLAFKIGKFGGGSLAQQVEEVRAMSTADLQSNADFVWKFSADHERPHGIGQLVCVPPGYITLRASKFFCGCRFGFGGNSEGSRDTIQKTLEDLFADFPVLRAGAYESFFEFLKGLKFSEVPGSEVAVVPAAAAL
jgi:hypothetical protein